jgi:hypothetical protein
VNILFKFSKFNLTYFSEYFTVLERNSVIPKSVIQILKLCLSHSPETRPSAYTLYQIDLLTAWRPYSRLRHAGLLKLGWGVKSADEADEIWSLLKARDEIDVEVLLEALKNEMQAEMSEAILSDLEHFSNMLSDWIMADSFPSKGSDSSRKVRKAQFRFLWTWVGPDAPILSTIRSLSYFIEREQLIPSTGFSFLFAKDEEEMEGGRKPRKRISIYPKLKRTQKKEGSSVVQLSHQHRHCELTYRSQSLSSGKSLSFALNDSGAILIHPEYGRDVGLDQILSMLGESEATKGEFRVDLQTVFGPNGATTTLQVSHRFFLFSSFLTFFPFFFF